MGEIRTVKTLRAKREEISASAKLYEDRIKQARADLAHVNACIKIFEASVCKETLASGPKLESKGLDTGDKVLAKAVAAQLIHQLRMQASRGKIIRDGKRGTALVWRLPG